MKKRTGDGKGNTPRRRYEIVAGPEPHVAEVSAESLAWPRTISATEAARHFSDLVNRVGYRGERYIIERGGKAMCELVPAGARGFTGGDFLALLDTLPHPDAAFLDAVEALTAAQAPLGTVAWES